MGQKCCSCCCRKSADLQRQTLTYQDSFPTSEGSTYEALCFVVALHPFQANGPNELSFDKGDKLEILKQNDEDWWYARHSAHTRAGYIPVPFVALSSSLESHEWYHGEMTRMETEQLLMSNLNSPGAFLMRKSKRFNCYVLSIKTFRKDGYNIHIKHYNITENKATKEFIIMDENFITLNDLVDYFIQNGNVGLPPTMLKHPCVRPAPTMQDISRDTRDKWEIPRDEVGFVEKLGSGSFGEVWLGKWNNTVDIAIKMMKEDKMNAEDFLAEAKVMKKLHHPNILKLYAVCSQEKPLLIITEYMDGGALLEVLREEPELTMQLKLYIATQAASGMDYLEREKVIHRDLAARNILVGQCYVCKVADFGLSKLYEEAIYKDGESKGKLPYKWTAPEALLKQKYTSKSDVWSFGVMMMEIITDGAIPYPGYNPQELIEELCQGYRMPKPQNCPDKLYELILKCWCVRPDDRPTFYFLNDYLQNYDVQSESSYYEADAY